MQRWSRQRPHNQRWTCKGVRQGSLCNLTYILPVTCKICSKILWIPIQLVCTSSENSNALESELHRVLRSPHMVMLVTNRLSSISLIDGVRLLKRCLCSPGRNEWVHSQIGKKYFQYSTSFCADVLKKSEDIPQRWISKGNNCCEWWPLFLKTHPSQENTWIHCIRNISCSWRITRCQSYWLWKLYLFWFSCGEMSSYQVSRWGMLRPKFPHGEDKWHTMETKNGPCLLWPGLGTNGWDRCQMVRFYCVH